MSVSPNAIYELLDQHYQSEYQDNDRLVFYSSFNIGDDFLKHLYQAANLIDISNFFILICTPFDIKQKLNESCKKHSIDEIPFHSEIFEICPTEKILNNFIVSETLCTEPWMHLEVGNTGLISPCCVSKQTVGNITEDRIEMVFSNQHMLDLRQQMLSGNKPKGCEVCWNLEDQGLESNRLKHLSLNKRTLLTKLISSPTIKSLDLKPGVTCNFKCRICGPHSSSLHIQELAAQKKIVIHPLQDWIQSQFDQISNLIDHLENIDMYGGEPFLMKNLTALVRNIVEKGRAKDIRLHYNSNGSIYPDFLIKYWQHFKHIDLHFSIDNIGKRFEIERGGDWNVVERNIKNLIDQKLPNLKISIMPTVNIMNVLYLDEIIAWAENLGLDVSFNYLIAPRCLSISELTIQAKKTVVDKYKNNLDPKINQILQVVESSRGNDGGAFIEYMENYDRLRKEKFIETHPEISIAMGVIH